MEEADLLNVALFGCTAKQWREANPSLHLKGLNIRDIADANQLLVLSNLESINAAMMQSQTDKYQRLLSLKKYAETQLKTLRSSTYTIEKIQSPFLPDKKTDLDNDPKENPENHSLNNDMYKYSIILILTCLPFVVFAQSETAKINFIKAQYADINATIKLDKKEVKEDTVETTEGNEVTLYFKADTIKKISVVYYGETGKALEEYYFFNKKLIFYYKAEYRYNVPINVNNGNVKIASKKEKKYYLNDDKIFLVKYNPKETISPSGFTKLSIETRKEASRLLHLK